MAAVDDSGKATSMVKLAQDQSVSHVERVYK